MNAFDSKLLDGKTKLHFVGIGGSGMFPLVQIPEMGRGAGVRLQKYRDGGIADVKLFVGSEGLSWTDAAGRQFTRSLAEMKDWCGNRAEVGRLPPSGFPKTNHFDDA